jgi:DNA-binding response OmpR family regulator
MNVTYRVGLTRIEAGIMDVLEARNGCVVSREAILTALGDLTTGDPQSVSVHVSRIRRKLGHGAIVSASGYGYRLGNVHTCPTCSGTGVVE